MPHPDCVSQAAGVLYHLQRCADDVACTELCRGERKGLSSTRYAMYPMQGCIEGCTEGCVEGGMEGCIDEYVEGCIEGCVEGCIKGCIEGCVQGGCMPSGCTSTAAAGLICYPLDSMF